MVDLETMAVTPDAAIVSIGAIKFNPNKNLVQNKDKGFYVELDWMDQNRTINLDTEKWWAQQSDEARKSLHGIDELPDALLEFSEWLPEKEFCIWGNGSHFDVSILEHAYRQSEIPIPWKFWNVRDCRTVRDMYETARGGFDQNFQGTKHHALHDAIYKARYICKMWKELTSK